MFSQTELNDFVNIRGKYINPNTYGNIKRVASYIWTICGGKITQKSLDGLTDFYLTKYHSESQREKCFNYTRAFLKYLYKIRMDSHILSFISVFEKPNYRKERKMLTSRIIVQEDIEKALIMIQGDNSLPDPLKLRYKTMLLFLAYSGQRPVTAGRLRVNQFKEALSREPYVLTVEAKQDKIRMEHYVPLHPALIHNIRALIRGKKETDTLFTHQGLQVWLKNNSVSLSHCNGKLQAKDIRKFFEQKSDEIGFTDANKAFIMSHGVSSINWTSYKQFLPENVYKMYMEYWQTVTFDNIYK